MVVICDPLVLSAARSRSGRWTVEGDRAVAIVVRGFWLVRAETRRGAVKPLVGERSGGAVSPARMGRVHRTLAVEPSVDSDLGRAAERLWGLCCSGRVGVPAEGRAIAVFAGWVDDYGWRRGSGHLVGGARVDQDSH